MADLRTFLPFDAHAQHLTPALGAFSEAVGHRQNFLVDIFFSAHDYRNTFAFLNIWLEVEPLSRSDWACRILISNDFGC